MTMNKPLLLLCVPLLLMLLIFLFSSQTAKTQSIKEPLKELLGNSPLSAELSKLTIHYGSLTVDGKKEGAAAVAEFFLRKLAHVIEYALLGCCLVWAMLKLTHLRFPPAALLSLSACAGYAALDECHQLFVQGRGPRPQDVLLDTCGALAGILVHAAWRRIRKRHAGPKVDLVIRRLL